MGSLTIRLDEKTDAMLEHFSEVLQQNKSSLVRASIVEFLTRQAAIEQEKAALESKIGVNSHADVQSRATESEASYHLSDEAYEEEMDHFFAKELGLVR